LSDDDDYQPYIPVKQRRKAHLDEIVRKNVLISAMSSDEEKSRSGWNVGESDYSNQVDNKDSTKDELENYRKTKLSLLDQHSELKKKAEAKKENDFEKQLKEEEKILESVAEKKALMAVSELAKGIQYEDPIET